MDFSNLNVTPTGRHIVQIGFFATTGCCSCGHRYAHVEVRFSDYSVTSITRAAAGTVHITPHKGMSNPNYRCFFEISVDPETEQRMMAYARQACQRTRFSVVAMYWNFIPGFRGCPIRATRSASGSNGTFCSAYVCNLLQEAGFCEDLDPDRTSPDDLYNALRLDDRVVCARNSTLR